ncbi:MAG: glycosyltransferase [Bacteroidia bacterium]|nr:glycosyltransferase [Bacteroidia bacterium]
MHVLFIGTVWPEPNSSAAGSRTLQLIEFFQSLNWTVSFASSASKSDFSFDLTGLNITEYHIQLNSHSFDTFIGNLQPNIVVFDRFMIEEQYGWRVSEFSPNSLRVLDTIDLHCLRIARQQAHKEKREFNTSDLLEIDISKREIASVFRCDCSLMISKAEMEILRNVFKVDAELLFYLPFLIEELPVNYLTQFSNYEQRMHFVTIGNFLHEPNWNSVLYLKEDIWPIIRQQLKDVELHIYGAYPSAKVMQLHNEKEGFLIKGRAEDVKDVMMKARVCLAPLRFGAGLKGKLLDAMLYGTPSVTTDIGAEGMCDDLNWNGYISNQPNDFAQKAIQLYQNKHEWELAQQQGVQIVNQVFNKKEHTTLWNENINFLLSNIVEHRRRNFIGSMLLHHTISGTKYMSRWIEAKNNKGN